MAGEQSTGTFVRVPPDRLCSPDTGIIVTEAAALAAGDTVSIRIAQIGELSNTAEIVN